MGKLIYAIFLFNFKIDTINILNIISKARPVIATYFLTQNMVQHVPKIWPVVSICFPTQNMKRGLYLQSVAGQLHIFVFLLKI